MNFLKSIIFNIFLVQSIFLAFCKASEGIDTDKKTYYVEVVKGKEWLLENTTRIYSLVTTVSYIENGTKEPKEVTSEFSAPMGPEGCEAFDVEHTYSNYYYFVQPEGKYNLPNEKKSGGLPYSNWFEGRKLDGDVDGKIVTYCFAN